MTVAKKKPGVRKVGQTLTLFNNKGGVGKTTLTFNLAAMFARQGRRVVVIDFDPQCNLTALALSEAEMEALWEAPGTGGTVATCLERVRAGKGDLHEPELREIFDGFYLLPGDLSLSRFESRLAREWPQILAEDAEAAIHVTTALNRLTILAADIADADLVMLDVGPSLGALNRAALLATDAVVVPLAPDLFSVRGLQNVGEALHEWQEEWSTARIKILQRAKRAKKPPPFLPENNMAPLGYIVQQHLVYGDSPIRAYSKWMDKIPTRFAKDLCEIEDERPEMEEDPYCLGFLRHFASLVPLAQAANKPLFELKHADGVIGSQFQTVAQTDKAFSALAKTIGHHLDAL